MKRKHFIQAGIIATVGGFLASCRKYFADPIDADEVLPKLSTKEGIKKYREAAISEGYQPPVHDIDSRVAKTIGRVANFYHLGAEGVIDKADIVIGEPTTIRNFTACRFSVPIKKIQAKGSEKIKSCWMAIDYYATMPDGSKQLHWAQWGYATHRDWGLIPAFFIYRINPTYILSDFEIVYINNNVPLAYNGRNDQTPTTFEIRNKPGTTVWIFSRSGQDIMEIDLRASIADLSLEVVTESWGGDSFSPELHITNVEIFKNGSWQKLNNGRKVGAGSWAINGTGISEFKVGV